MAQGRLKIAMLCIHSSPIGAIGTRDTGGMSIYVRELAQDLGRHGHYVDIYTRPPVEPSPQVVVVSDTVRIIHLDVPDSRHCSKLELYPLLPDFLLSLISFASRDGVHYDLVYSHYWLSGCLGDCARQLWAVPHLVTFHTLGALKNGCSRKQAEPELRINAEKNLVQHCSRVIMASERERRNLIQHYGIASNKTGVVPCGVDFERFQPMDRQAARSSLGLDQHKKLILYVGRSDPLKGIDCLMEAVSLLPDRQDLCVMIVGENDYADPGFTTMLDRLGMRNNVRFAGRIEHSLLPLYYNAADILAIPSRYESFGLVALEALACGTPVVTTPVGAMESIICPGESGMVVSDFSVRTLSEGLNESMAGASAMQPEAIRSSILGYTWSRTAAGVLKHCYSAIEEQQARCKARPHNRESVCWTQTYL